MFTLTRTKDKINVGFSGDTKSNVSFPFPKHGGVLTIWHTNKQGREWSLDIKIETSSINVDCTLFDENNAGDVVKKFNIQLPENNTVKLEQLEKINQLLV